MRKITLNHCLYRTLFLLLLLLQNILFAELVYAQSDFPAVQAAKQQLAIEIERNAVAADQLYELQKNQQLQLQKLSSQKISPEFIEHAKLDSEMARVDLVSINLTLREVQQTVTVIENNIRNLQEDIQGTSLVATTTSWSQTQLIKLKTELAYQQQLLKISQARIKVLIQAQNMAKQRIELFQYWETDLQELYQTYQHQRRQQALNKLAVTLQRQQQAWVERLATLNRQAKLLADQGQDSTPEYEWLSLLIFEAEERSNLNHLHLSIARVKNQLEDLIMEEDINHSVTFLQHLSKQEDALIHEIQQINELLYGKIGLIKQRLAIEAKSKVNINAEPIDIEPKQAILNDLMREYQKLLAAILNVEKQARAQRELLSTDLRGAIARRQGLPGFNMQEWVSLGKDLVQMSQITIQAVRSIYQDSVAAIKEFTASQMALLIIFEFAWLGLWIILRRNLRSLIQKLNPDKERFSANTLLALVKLLRRNLTGLAIFAGLLTLLFMVNATDKIVNLVLPIGLVWFGFKFALGIARLALFEGPSFQGGHDVKLYYNLKWTFLAGSILTILTVLAYQLPVSYEVLDLFNRLLMLFILIAAIMVLKRWHVVPELLAPYVHVKRGYLKRIIRLLGFLIPLMILSNAVLGLVGYVALAWTISRYEGLFLLMLTAYLIVKGLLKDIMELLSTLVIRNFRNGWLWSEALLKPFDTMLHIALLLFAGALLFNLYGWDEHSPVYLKLVQMLHFKLFALGGSAFTMITLIQLVIIISILVWATRWAREFAYRWMFARTKDLGLRNSLAVFTQYTTVTVGIFVALKVLGIDSNSLTFVATGLAIGLGFGLRDLANNFVSGLLLLIERPVRKGDIVTIGDYDGVVIDIGMRAITVFTSDNSEVLVPNSEVFSKSFINWTHQDSIVRSTVEIKVSRTDDPHLIQTAILEVLRQTPGVVSEPLSEVHLKNMNDTVLEFQVRYYINLYITASRSEMRSRVIFAIWDRFKAMGIEPPHPQQDIHVKSLPSVQSDV